MLAALEAADRAYVAARAWRRAARDREVFSLYVVGESSAYGWPYGPRIDIGKIARLLFSGRINGREIEVRTLAEPGTTLLPQLLKLEHEIRDRDVRQPGAVFVYCGHNEREFWRPASRATALGGSLEDFALRHSLFLSDVLSVLERGYARHLPRDEGSYERYLGEVVRESRAAGLTPIVSTVVGNIADIEPGLFESPAWRREDLLGLVERGERLESARRYSEAIRYYRAEIARLAPDPSSGAVNYLRFRLGKCLQAAGRYRDARTEFWKASDGDRTDSFPRATRSQNAAVRRIAKRYGIPLVDAVALFESRAEHGLVGDALFADGHHPDIRGELLLAEGFARALSAATGAASRPERLSPERVFAAFGFGPSDQVRAHLKSAGWLLAESARHLYPRWRLTAARRHCEDALRIDPCRAASWALLSVVLARTDGERVSDDDLRWLEGLVYRSSTPGAGATVEAELRRRRFAVPDAAAAAQGARCPRGWT